MAEFARSGTWLERSSRRKLSIGNGGSGGGLSALSADQLWTIGTGRTVTLGSGTALNFGGSDLTLNGQGTLAITAGALPLLGTGPGD